MSLTAGALSKVLVGQTTAILSSAAATGGTGPYTYQWYQSTTSGFSPGAGNIVTGATNLSQSFSGLNAGTTYYFEVVVTDTGNSNVTANSTQLSFGTQPSQLQNQVAQTPLVGLVDLRVGSTNVVAAQVDASVTTQIFPGQAVKLLANSKGGLWKVAPIASKSDSIVGFATFNVKDVQYLAGQNLEVALFGTCIWLYATGAITQGAECCVDPTFVGGVQATGNTATWVGQAFDGAASAGMIRVLLMSNVSYATA